MANSIVEVVAHKDTVDLETNLAAMMHNVNIPKSNKLIHKTHVLRLLVLLLRIATSMIILKIKVKANKRTPIYANLHL